jgi:hypothetical protein
MNSSSSQAISDEACFVNIGPKERQKRLTVGLISWAAGIALFVVLQAIAVPWWANLATFPFFAGGASGFFQWRDKT